MSIDTSPAFAHSCVQTTVLPVGVDEAYAAIFDLSRWERLLPHILELDGLQAILDCFAGHFATRTDVVAARPA